MDNKSKQLRKSLLSQILNWLKRICSWDDTIVINWDELEKAELLKKIRAIIVKNYPEKLYLDIFSQRELKFKPLPELRSLLANLENPKQKEPD